MRISSTLKSAMGIAVVSSAFVACGNPEGKQGDSEGTVVEAPKETSEVARPNLGPDLVVFSVPNDGDDKDQSATIAPYSADGTPSSGQALEVASISDTQLIRFADGYAVPDANSVVLLSSELQRTQAVAVKDIDKESALTSAASSQTHQSAILSFTLPPEKGGTVERTRIVNLHAKEESAQDSRTDGNVDSQIITRKGDISGLTSCDDGSAAWLEFNPSSAADPDGAGLASLVTWTAENGVESYPLDYSFQGRPFQANQLDCSFKHHRLLAPDGDGGVINIGVQRRYAEYKAVGKRTVKDARASDIDGEQASIRGDYFTSITDEGKLRIIDMYKGAVVDSLDFRDGFMKNRSIDGTDADGDFFYVTLDRTDNDSSDSVGGGVVIMDYTDSSCRANHNIELKDPKNRSVRAVYAQGNAAVPDCASENSD